MSYVLRLSIGFNMVLMGIITALLWRGQSAAMTVRPASTRSEMPNIGRPTKEFRSQDLGSKPTPTAIAQLERMGISRDILINVLLEDLNRRSARRILELQKRYAPRSVPDHAMRELSRESVVEQILELKESLGEEGYLAWDKEQTLHALNRARVPGNELPMTAVEAEQAYRLQKEFDEKNRELQIMMENGVADTADTGTLQAQAQQALDRELEKLLGKQRFDELRGNTDPTAEVYRTFGDMNPTPDQAKAVLEAEADFRARETDLSERLKAKPINEANLAAELKAMKDAQEENLRRVFGAEAYDTMKRQNDPTYKTLQQYAEAWQLNDHEIQSVYTTLTALFDQTDRTRNAAEMREAAGQRVNWREINSTIEQARQQAEAGLQNQIGGERLRRLKKNGILMAR